MTNKEEGARRMCHVEGMRMKVKGVFGGRIRSIQGALGIGHKVSRL